MTAGTWESRTLRVTIGGVYLILQPIRVIFELSCHSHDLRCHSYFEAQIRIRTPQRIVF